MAKPQIKSDHLTNLDKAPPCIVRLHAIDRTGDKPRLLTNLELAKKSGLSRRMIQRLGAKNSWEGVKAEVIGKFLAGCDASLTNFAWYKEFIDEFAESDPPFSHVTDSRSRKTVYKAMSWPMPK